MVCSLEARHAAAQARMTASGLSKQQFIKNTFKCGKCMRMYHAGGSPLALCDFCPKAFHVECLGKSLAALPPGEWGCPKCYERQEVNKQKLHDLEAKKKEALERVVTVPTSPYPPMPAACCITCWTAPELACAAPPTWGGCSHTWATYALAVRCDCCTLHGVWPVQAERKREKKQAKRVQYKEEKERRRTEGRVPREAPKRSATAVVPDAVVDDTVDDAEALEEERRSLDMLEVSPSAVTRATICSGPRCTQRLGPVL